MRFNDDTDTAWTTKDYLLIGALVMALLFVVHLSMKLQVWTIVALAKYWGYL